MSLDDTCPGGLPGCACCARAEGLTAFPPEQGTPLHALITSGYHMQVAIESLRAAFAELDKMMLGEEPTDEEIDNVFERVAESIASAGNAVYEWDKRARRTGVDWWNR